MWLRYEYLRSSWARIANEPLSTTARSAWSTIVVRAYGHCDTRLLPTKSFKGDGIAVSVCMLSCCKSRTCPRLIPCRMLGYRHRNGTVQMAKAFAFVSTQQNKVTSWAVTAGAVIVTVLSNSSVLIVSVASPSLALTPRCLLFVVLPAIPRHKGSYSQGWRICPINRAARALV